MKVCKFFTLMAIVIVMISSGAFVNAQTAPAPYGEVNFIKTKPNMNESFLIDMKTSKRLANARKANKTINSWQLYRRVYPRGESMDYNYAALTVFPSGVEMKAEGTWDTGVRELSVKEISDFLTSLGNVRTTTATDLYTYQMGTMGTIKSGDYVQLNLVKTKAGMSAAYIKQLESFKMVVDECVKAGKLKGMNVWKRTYATNIGGESNYTVSFTFASLDQALSWASGKTTWSDEFKKLFPKEDYNAYSAKWQELREVNSQELWELVDITD
jgi:hypothetical protein